MTSIISNKISNLVTYFQRKHAENEEIIRMARNWTSEPIYCVRHPQTAKYWDIRKAASHLPELMRYTCEECEREGWLAQPLHVDPPGQFAAAMSQALRSAKHSTDEIEIPQIADDIPQLPFPETPFVVVRESTPRDEKPDPFFYDISVEDTHKLSLDEYDEITEKRPAKRTIQTDPRQTVQIPALELWDRLLHGGEATQTTGENERIERMEVTADDNSWLR